MADIVDDLAGQQLRLYVPSCHTLQWIGFWQFTQDILAVHAGCRTDNEPAQRRSYNSVGALYSAFCPFLVRVSQPLGGNGNCGSIGPCDQIADRYLR